MPLWIAACQEPSSVTEQPVEGWPKNRDKYQESGAVRGNIERHSDEACGNCTEWHRDDCADELHEA